MQNLNPPESLSPVADKAHPTPPPVGSRRGRLASLRWVLLGLFGSLLAFAFGVSLASTSIGPDEDYAIILYALTGFVAYIISIVGMGLWSFVLERKNRRFAGQASRTSLILLGALIPLVLVVLAVFVPQIVMGG